MLSIYYMLLNSCIPLTLVRQFVTQYEYTTSLFYFQEKKNSLVTINSHHYLLFKLKNNLKIDTVISH